MEELIKLYSMFCLDVYIIIEINLIQTYTTPRGPIYYALMD